MRASVDRGVGREGGDKALAANTNPNDECKSNYYCGRKRHSKLVPEARRGTCVNVRQDSPCDVHTSHGIRIGCPFMRTL